MAERAGGWGLPALGAVARSATGDRAAALAEVSHLVTTGDADQVAQAGAVAAASGFTAVADSAIDRLPQDDPRRARLLALTRHAQGHHRAALAALVGHSDGPSNSLRRRIAGDLSALDALGRISRTTRRDPIGDAADPPSRVLHVAYNALPEVQAGYTLRTQGIAAAQRRAGMQVDVVTRPGFPVDSGALGAPVDVTVDGVRYHRLLRGRPLPSVAGERIDRYGEEVTRLAMRLGVDVLHAHSRHDNAQAALIAGRQLGLPVVYEMRGFIEETWRSRGGDPAADEYRLFKAAETECMLAADRVVTLSTSMAEDIVGRGVPADRVEVVGNAVGGEFLAAPPDPAPVRRRFGFAPTDVVLGVVSTLNDYEGIDLLIAAVLRARRIPGHEGLRLLIVGGGPAEADLRTLAAGEDAIVMTGKVPHHAVRDYHSAIDVFCVPRRLTPVTAAVPPLKPIEAMATGRPVLVSDLPPLRELVETSGAGEVAAPDDVDAWVGAITRLYAHPDRTAMGARARQWVLEHRTWSAAADRYQSIYRAAIAHQHHTKE